VFGTPTLTARAVSSCEHPPRCSSGRGTERTWARAGADLAAVAGFHASLGLNTPAPAPGTIKAKILVLNGADDPFVKREQYDAFKKDLDAAKADYRVIEYPGAVHAFTNPEATELGEKFKLPLKYDAKVDQEAKAEATKFFAAGLQK
jgi:dienelactone hydrolase